MVAVLHTHSRRLDLHPHVHFAMPAATLDARTRRWRTKSGYLFNQALAKVFRGKLLAALKQAGLTLPSQLPKKWVADCKASATARRRSFISAATSIAGAPGVRYPLLRERPGQLRYRDSQSGETKVRTLPGADFCA